MKKGIIMFGIICSVVTALGFMPGVKRYQYDTYFNLPGRPYPTEILFEITAVEPYRQFPKIKIESVVPVDYTHKLTGKPVGNRKGYAEILLTDRDFEALSPAVGDVYAGFGLRPAKGILFRLLKYTGPRDEAAMEAWFKESR